MLPAGTVLEGRYEVESTLGQGGMGAVYRVADKRLSGKPWALKAVTLASADRALLRQEAELLSRLDHPNLPRVVDYFESAEAGFIVMELVEGRTLDAQVREQGPLAAADAFDLGRRLCDTLEYLHSRQPPIIFRDLKPGNVMVQPGGGLKLIDFGIARRFAPGRGNDTTALGTPGYAAPEQYGKAQSDARTDIYGLGATLYNALSGLDPSDQGLPLKPLKKLFSKVPERLSDVLEQCTAVSPADRYAGAAEARQALAAASLPPPPPSQAAATQVLGPPWWHRFKRRPRPLLPPPKVETTRLDFGLLTRGTTRQLPIEVHGSGFRVVSDSPWVRVKRKQGHWFACLDGRRMPPGRHQGSIRIESQGSAQHLPITAELQPDHASPWLTGGFVLLCLWGLVPLFGVVSFPLMLMMYLGARSSDVRAELTTYLWIGALLFCLNALGSEMAWIFLRHLWQS